MSTLEQIEPQGSARVMDLVEHAGIDVSDWAHYAKGDTAPAANPKYCYEWAFTSDELIVLNLWFDNMKCDHGRIVHHENYRADAEEHRARGAKSNWHQRGFNLDRALQKAIRDDLPVRVIVNHGNRREDDDTASKVTMRRLDASTWTISEYDWTTGECLLVRGHHSATHG